MKVEVAGIRVIKEGSQMKPSAYCGMWMDEPLFSQRLADFTPEEIISFQQAKATSDAEAGLPPKPMSACH